MSFTTAGATGGEYKHKLTVSEIPSHHHTYNNNLWVQNGGYGSINASASSGANKANITSAQSNSTGGGSSHNNIQPYIVVYLWKRTA